MREIFDVLGLPFEMLSLGAERYHSRYCVTSLAAHAIGAVGQAAASLSQTLGLLDAPPKIAVDARLSSLWFGWSIRPTGWEMPPAWDAIAGDYKTSDGWIKLHTNLAHHRRAACKVLNVTEDRAAVAAAVSKWNKDELETAIVSAGGVAAALRTREEWRAHPQGRAVAQERLVAWTDHRRTPPRQRPATGARPLAGLRVLDMTRVLAGPVATRTLAGLGADILRIDPPHWEEANVEPDVTLGKRCARIDLRSPAGLERLERLLADADILVHGYRPGALDGLGIGENRRREIAPHLIEATLDAYGWTGPWAGRRGFDSLVQMSSGIAAAGMDWAKSEKPTPLPVQALDHATGYLMAAAVIAALDAQARDGSTRTARLSLARTAELLAAHEQESDGEALAAPGDRDYCDEIEQTPWGPAKRLRSPLKIGDTRLQWERPACAFGSWPAEWPNDAA